MNNAPILYTEEQEKKKAEKKARAKKLEKTEE